MVVENPEWVAQGLADILGFDKDTVEQMLLPEFDGYTNETKLRMHLQDFLGPSSAAKDFTSRYLAFRFPSIASSSSSSSVVPNPTASSSTSFAHPDKPSSSNSNSNTNTNTAVPSKAKSSRASPSLTPKFNNSRNAPPAITAEDLTAHFGGSGKIYQKNRDADETSFLGVGSARHTGGSGSGSNSPLAVSRTSSGQPLKRVGGAVTVHQVQAKHPHGAKGGEMPHQNGSGSGSGGNKGGDKIWDLPKSRAVKKLEAVIKNLKDVQSGEGKVKVDEAREECFCQARNHPLSPYTPHCQSCGLILCSLHPAHLPCPSCQSSLYSPAQLARLIHRVQSEIDDQLARELAEREKEEQRRLQRLAAESGGGAFPVLAGGGSGGLGGGPAGSSNQAEQARKVLTLGGGGGGAGSKGKGKGKSTVTLTTTTYSKPVSATPTRPSTPPPTDIVPCPRTTPLDAARIEKELSKVLKWREEEDRPWGDMKKVKKGEEWKYLESKVLVMFEEDRIGRRRKKKEEGKGIGLDGRKVVGAAG